MANPTTEVAIWLALKARVKSFATSPALPVFWPGETAAPTGAHVEVMNIVAPPERVLLKAGPHDRRGTLQLMLKHPLAALQYEVTQELAGKIAEHFPCDLMMRFGSACVRVIAAPEVHEGFRDEGWWVTPVRVRWQSLI